MAIKITQIKPEGAQKSAPSAKDYFEEKPRGENTEDIGRIKITKIPGAETPCAVPASPTQTPDTRTPYQKALDEAAAKTQREGLPPERGSKHHKGKYDYRRTVRNEEATQQARDVIGGVTHSAKGNAASFLAALVEAAEKVDKQYRDAKERAGVRTHADEMRATTNEEITRGNEEAIKMLHGIADEQHKQARESNERAKENVGTAGKIGISALQMGMNLAAIVGANAAIPGSGIVMMGVQGGGAAAQEYRNHHNIETDEDALAYLYSQEMLRHLNDPNDDKPVKTQWTREEIDAVKERYKYNPYAAAGLALGGLASAGIGSAAAKGALKYGGEIVNSLGLGKSKIAQYALGALSDAAFSGGISAANEYAKAAAYGDSYEEVATDGKELAKDMLFQAAVGFLCRTLTSSFGRDATGQPERTKREYFKDVDNLDDLAKAFKQYRRQYHPDRYATADAATQKEMSDIFARISAEYNAVKAELAVESAGQAAKSYSDRRNAKTPEAAAAARRTAENELMVLKRAVENGTLTGADAAEAVQIMEATLRETPQTARQNTMPAQPAAAQEGAQGAGEGNLTPMPQNAAQGAQEASTSTAIESAFMSKEKGSAGAVLNIENMPPQVTPEAPQRANASFDNTVPQESGGVEAQEGAESAQTAQADNTTTAGGMNHGGQEVQNHAGGTELAEAGERAGLPDGNGRRDNGARTGEQIGSVGGGRPQRTADQSRTALERQDRARDLRLEKVSSAELGVRMGTDEKSVTVLPKEAWDDELRDVVRRIEWESGKKTTMVVGPIRIRTDRGARSVRGVWTRDGIIIRTDNMRISAEQIADHEIFHEYADQNPGLIQAVERSIREKYGSEEFDRIVTTYVQNLRGIIDIDENAADYEAEQALLDVKNEILADAYADINAFGQNAGKYREEVRQTLRERGITDGGSETAAATERRTGPPERFSVLEEVEGENGTYGKGVMLDTNLFDGIRPRDWGKTLGRYVYNNMAGMELTAYDAAGKPETIYLARTNDRVQKDGAKNSRKVIDKLARSTGDNIRSLAVVHLDEALTTSRYENSTDEHNHQWMDENGWEHRKTYLQDRSGNIYEATLNIADGRDRKILYDINNIRLVDKAKSPDKHTAAEAKAGEITGGAVPSAVTGGARSTSRNFSEKRIADKSENVKYSAFNEEVARQLAGEEPEKTKFSAEDEEDGMREFPNLDAYLSGERRYTAETEDFYRRADEELADRTAEREREEEKNRWVREWKREAAQERAYAKAERDAKREDAGNLKPTNKTAAPAAASEPTIAKNDLRKTIEDMFSIPDGERHEAGKVIDQCADSILKNGALTQEERERFLDRMYAAGVVQTEGLLRAAGEYIAPRRVYVDKSERALFGEDWNSFRTRASAAGVTLLVRMPENGSATGVDALRAGLAEQLPTVFDPRETSARETLERMVQLAEEGKDENLSLGEYISEVAGKDFIREKQLYDELERKMDNALQTFAEKAGLEIKLRDRASAKIAQEREHFDRMRQTERAAQKERESAQKAKDRAENEERERKARERDLMRKADAQERRIEAARRRRENREMKELQQKTLKQLQWLSKNRNRAPEAMKDAWDEVLGDIDIYATSAANEMHWSDKHQATWGDLAQMYKVAQKNDPNFLPSKELERIVSRLDDEKIADMDIDALQNLYKAAVGLRTEFYNRNKVIADEEHALFSELYGDVKQELRAAGGRDEPTGAKGAFDRYANDWQLTPMNTLERMAGWNRDSKWFKMAKQLEKGEREKRRYEVKAKRQLSGWLADNAEWVKKADGQGDDAIWYEVEVPELLELGMGDKPIFGDTIKVYMTPAQKVHMYLESKSHENLRHMVGGRTFADKELYSKGKRMKAFAKGKTIKLAPETVKKLTEDLTPEERELAHLLEDYYNQFAKKEINRVSNILYGYDKAVSKNYAPIYTNSNYVKNEPGVYNATAEGVGNLKPRQHSKNPSYNIGAFDAFEKHVDQTARFVGMAIPVRNWNTLMNWGDGKDSMADVVTHEWGLDAKTFIEKLLTELQDGKQSEQGKADRLISKALSNYISSVFGFNPSIVLKQAASFPLAAAYLDPKDMPNIGKALKADDELIETYTSELSYRLLGYATPETAMLKNHPGKLQEKGVLNFVFGGGAITAMDGATVKTLWSWAEKKVQREHPELEKGTEEQIKRGESPFYQKVAEEFEEATSRSQPMYDVMHRSNIMRDSSGITRAFTLFKTVPQQEYNMLRQALGEAEYHKKNGSDAKTQKEAKKKVGRVVMSILAGNLMLGTITFLNSMAKNKGKRYRDENGELTPESVMKQFLEQFMHDSLGVAIFGDTASELIGSSLTGDKWYGIETPGIEQLNEMLEECKDACRLIPKTRDEIGDVLANGGSWTQYMKDNSSVYLSAIEKITETVATYLGGLPAENVKGYFLGMMKWIAPGAETEIEDLFDRPDKQGLKELDGKALETRVKNLLNDRVGSAPDEAVRRIAKLYESGYTDAAPSATPSYVTIDKVKHELDAGKTQKYENAWRKAIGGELSEMVRLPAFIRADEETQEKMLKKLYSYASDMAKAEVFKEYEMKKSTMEMSDLAKHGLSVAVQIVAAVSGENDPKGLSLPTP